MLVRLHGVCLAQVLVMGDVVLPGLLNGMQVASQRVKDLLRLQERKRKLRLILKFDGRWKSLGVWDVYSFDVKISSKGID